MTTDRTTTDVFNALVDAWTRSPRYIAEEGGARSGKTYSILQFLHELAKARSGRIISVVSETFPHLRRGAMRDFKDILTRAGEWDENAWSRSDSIYHYANGTIIEFFSADQPGKVLGPARDYLFINEAINIPWETARQLFIRTRKRIVYDFNPACVFWSHEHVQPREDCVTLHSTYKDNIFLPPEQVAEIESNKGDSNWWRVYGQGLLGQLEGVIYDFEQVDALPQGDSLRELYCLDFGFTHDPTAILHLKADTGRKMIYAQEVCYRTGMMNADIAAALKAAGANRSMPIYADCAEPKSIAEIRAEGLNIIPSDKDAPVKSDKRLFQIQWLQGWKLCFTKDSLNLIREARNYTWAKDRDGHLMNRPIEGFDHALDALRYGCWTALGAKSNYGHYRISLHGR